MFKKEKKDSDLVKSMKEFVDFVKGDKNDCDVSLVFNGEVINIRKIRKNLNMSREKFAKTFSFSVRSLQNWERGFRKPNAHTLAYLKLISQDPIYVQEKLLA